MQKQLTKGNEAIVKAAVLAGCRAFYGYPITPASEIAEAAALYLPRAGGVFVQAESEVAAINMLYGGAAAGVRCMTASSGPGISLMQEGISYLAGAELPCVIADIMRAGPGLGNIAPEQGDYNQIVKGGGHGNYRTLVLAPDSVQEMADLTTLAFDLADRYRNPVVVLADGFIGQMMEPVRLRRPGRPFPRRPSGRCSATPQRARTWSRSIYLEPDNHGAARPQAGSEVRAGRRAAKCAPKAGAPKTPKSSWWATASWAASCKAVVEQARARGIARGPAAAHHALSVPHRAVRAAGARAKAFAVVELSTGQMVDDVRLALEGRGPVEFFSRVGGNVPVRRRSAGVSGTHFPAACRSLRPCARRC